MFSGNKTPSFGGSGFGNNQGTTPAADSSSFFSNKGQSTPFSNTANQSNQNTQPSSIFGNSQPASTGNQQTGPGLFAKNTSTPAPATTTPLFGGLTTPQTNNTPQPNTGSNNTGAPIFGNNQAGNTAKEPAKLFGNNQTSGQGTQPGMSTTPSFGQTTNTLFSNSGQTPTQPNTNTSDQIKPLFGNVQSSQPQGGLQFGTQPAGGNNPTPTASTTTNFPSFSGNSNPTAGTTASTTPIGATSTTPTTPLFNTGATATTPNFSASNPATTNTTTNTNTTTTPMFGNQPSVPTFNIPIPKAPTLGGTQPNTSSQPTQPTTQTDPPKSTLFGTNPASTGNQTQNPLSGTTPTSTTPKKDLMQQTKINPPSTPINLQNQTPVDPQRVAAQYESSTKTIGEAFEEWKKVLAESDRQLMMQCMLIKQYEVDRKENHIIINNFQQLAPVVSHNQTNAEAMLDNIEKRQREMISLLMEIEQELGTEGNAKYRSDNSISMQIQSCRNIRKEINSEDQRYSGYQDQDPSNQQLRNIFFNLDSVQNQIRRLNHVLDHFFGKMTN